LLTKTEMGNSDPNAQPKVGTHRIMDLLKELEVARQERTEGNAIENTPVGSSKDISPEQNNKPVIGG